jgi:FKBP-type peptidyl-prolyl cis-trans isomerase FkpA
MHPFLALLRKVYLICVLRAQSGQNVGPSIARRGLPGAPLPCTFPVLTNICAQALENLMGLRKKMALIWLAALATAGVQAGTPEKSPSGLIYESLKEGAGEKASPAATVQVNYRGTLANGTEFDSSYKRGEPATFPLNRVIPCWTEGVAKMREGGKAKLTCPPGIAYGSRGAGSAVPPDATLTFEVELLKVMR